MSPQLQTPARIFDISAAGDVALVLRVRLLQRRLRWFSRLLRALMLIGVVAAFALLATRPELKLRRCAFEQQRARFNLQRITDAEEEHRAAVGSYGDLADLDFKSFGDEYTYAVTDTADGGYCAWAFGKAPLGEADVWSTNGRVVWNEANRCH